MSGLRRAAPIWLDVTRLITRAGRGPLTGVDRVEVAYLREALTLDARYLARTTRGYILLDHRGGTALLDMVTQTAEPGPADTLSRMLGKGQKMRHQVEGTLRALAIDRSLSVRLPQMVARQAPDAFAYLNVGHSNLSQRTLETFAGFSGAQVVVLIHDLIPITHPELTAEGMPERFGGRIARVWNLADVVICNSNATLVDLMRHWQGGAPIPDTMTAHLGADDPMVIPSLPREPGRFVMLGTVEARKNHALILDVWEALSQTQAPDQMPQLHIIGREGWRVEDLMMRLRGHPLLGQSIHSHGPLPDDEVAAHLARASALLFPSLAEGFGYPPLEAMRAGALPICSDLPVFRETLGDCAVYVSDFDPYSWVETIKKHLEGSLCAPDPSHVRVPSWDAHFETVGRALAHQRAEGP